MVFTGRCRRALHQCRRGVKMNKTAISRVATQAMLNAGFSREMVTEKQMSNLLCYRGKTLERPPVY
ncbi:TPA: hypothetical protein PXR57_000858, partial [Yersinia enterocolitica]|nr:hypothetical protein [Yersinia enterocolitica]